MSAYIDEVLLGQLVECCQRVTSQESKRKLRTVAMNEIRGLFANCGIEATERQPKRHFKEYNEDGSPIPAQKAYPVTNNFK